MADDEEENSNPESGNSGRYPKESYAEYLGLDKVPISFLLALGVLLTTQYFLSFRNEEGLEVIAAIWTGSYWLLVAIVLVVKWRRRA